MQVFQDPQIILKSISNYGVIAMNLLAILFFIIKHDGM